MIVLRTKSTVIQSSHIYLNANCSDRNNGSITKTSKPISLQWQKKKKKKTHIYLSINFKTVDGKSRFTEFFHNLPLVVFD